MTVGVRITGDSNVAVYDSVSGLPLPVEVFESVDHAEGFLNFVQGLHGFDPRQLTADELHRMREQWANPQRAA